MRRVQIRETIRSHFEKEKELFSCGIKTLIINGNDGFGGNEITVSDKQGRDIYRYLVKNDYIDEDDQVTDKYRADLANGVLAPVPESCLAFSDGVHALIRSIFDEYALDDMVRNGHETKIRENALNDNFYKKEFQTLWNYINHKSDNLKSGVGFVAEKSQTYTLDRAEGSQVTYNQTEGTYDSAIFTAEKNTDFSRAYRARKNVQDYVFTDGYAKDGQSVEHKFVENLDLAEEVCVYAKLPRGFSIPTPVGNYSPDWAIAFHRGTVKHIYHLWDRDKKQHTESVHFTFDKNLIYGNDKRFRSCGEPHQYRRNRWF